MKTADAKVLIVDDDPAQRLCMTELVESLGGTTREAVDGQAGLEAVAAEKPDLILLDVEMPRLNGLECCRRLKADPQTRLIPVVIITSLDTFEDRIRGIEAGADEFLTKPVRAPELLARMREMIRVKKLNESLESAENVIFALALAIEAKDKYTEGHTERVTANALQLGKLLGCSEDELNGLRQGGILHDVGKIGVPDQILNKPGPLTPEEFAIVKLHPLTGFRICSPLKSLAHALPCIRWHHEKPNGLGYPDGLKAGDIPRPALILAVADVFDALTSRRSYKDPIPPLKAISILKEEAAKGALDADMVRAFISLSGIDDRSCP